MSAPPWVRRLAAAFWDTAGGPEPFPRTLHDAVVRSAFDLTVKELPGLRSDGLGRYLGGQGIPWTYAGPDRGLRACMAARDGAGFFFLEADDKTEERTFSLAHELAHFLRHYWQPRQRARERLGDAVVEVLDGRRPPTPGERVHAVLRDVPLGLHLHLMWRDARRGAITAATAAVEEEADQLAYELLAPADAVLARVGPDRGAARRDEMAAALREVFGLPAAQAEDYAGLLLPPVWQDPLLLRLRP